MRALLSFLLLVIGILDLPDNGEAQTGVRRDWAHVSSYLSPETIAAQRISAVVESHFLTADTVHPYYSSFHLCDTTGNLVATYDIPGVAERYTDTLRATHLHRYAYFIQRGFDIRRRVSFRNVSGRPEAMRWLVTDTATLLLHARKRAAYRANGRTTSFTVDEQGRCTKEKISFGRQRMTTRISYNDQRRMTGYRTTTSAAFPDHPDDSVSLHYRPDGLCDTVRIRNGADQTTICLRYRNGLLCDRQWIAYGKMIYFERYDYLFRPR